LVLIRITGRSLRRDNEEGEFKKKRVTFYCVEIKAMLLSKPVTLSF